MSPTLQVLSWWAAFAGSHLVLSSQPVRSRLIARLGSPLFQTGYSLLVLGLFIPHVRTYFANKHTGPLLWSIPPSPILQWSVYVGSAIAFVLFVGGLITPSPAMMMAPGAPEPRGVLRITRHPILMGTALWALVHLPGNGSATDVAFFGSFVIFTLVGTWHQDRRKLAMGVPGYREFVAATPFIPFTRPGVLRGLREIAPAAAIGILATIVVRHFHTAWFGG
jgi:uncharacterized membrane protein